MEEKAPRNTSSLLRIILIAIGIILIIDSQLTQLSPFSSGIYQIRVGFAAIMLLYLLLSHVSTSDSHKYALWEKLASVILVLFLVSVVFSDYNGIHRFLIMVFLAVVGVPLMYYIVREEESIDRGELNKYPEKLTRIQKDDLLDYYKYPVGFNPELDEEIMKLKEKQEKRNKPQEEERQKQQSS
jgi:hypothetical protein